MAVIELVLEPVSAKQAVVAEATQAAAKAAPAAEEAPVEAEAAESKYAGSKPATADNAAPEGFAVKGNEDSMKFHVPGSRWYNETVAEVWFDSAESAAAAGFAPAGGDAAQAGDAE